MGGFFMLWRRFGVLKSEAKDKGKREELSLTRITYLSEVLDCVCCG